MELDLLERLAFADDRDAARRALLPGSEAHDYWRGVHLQQRGELDEVDAILADWTPRHGPERPLYRTLKRRQLLLRAGRDAAANADAIRFEAGLSLQDEPSSRAVDPSLPTRLDPLDPDRVIDDALGHAGDAARLTPQGLRRVIARPGLPPALRASVLTRLDRADLPDLVDRIAEDLERDQDLDRFGRHVVHKALDLDQLHQLAERRPGLREQAAWVEAVLTRCAPARHEDVEDLAVRAPWLDALWAFVKDLGRPFTTLKALVLGHRLLVDQRRDVLDRDRVATWLTLPRTAPWVDPDHLSTLRQEHPARVSDAVVGLPPIDEGALARSLLLRILATESAPDLRPHLSDAWYRETLATARLLAGDPDTDRWGRSLGNPALEALRDRVDLDLAPTNPTRWPATADVALDVDLKHVDRLTVKVFRLDTLRAFLTRGGDVDLTLDLDGLVAAHERTIALTEPPMRRVRRRIALPECARPGTYVVELIGNGRASRALIRKGRLRHTLRVGVAGVVIGVRDEDGAVVRDATLWLGAREIVPRDDGSLILPFSTQPRAVTALLVRGEVTTPITVHLPAESVSLSLGARLERESAVAGKTARLLLRPTLAVAGWPAPLGLIERPHVEVEVTDRHGITSTKRVEPALHDDEELSVDVTVPEDAVRLRARLRGQVQVRSTQQTVEVSADASCELDGLAGTDAVEMARLARTSSGYVLHVVGRTGEPRAGREVAIVLHHALTTVGIRCRMATDARGRIALGALDGVTAVRAVLPSGTGAGFTIARRHEVPATLHVPEGETVLLPGGSASVDEVRGDAIVRRAPGADRVGRAVRVGPLPPGTYRLHSDDWTRTVDLVVVAGGRSGWAGTPTEQLELPPPPPAITTLSVVGDDVVAQVRDAGPLTRLHVVATRFLPDPLADGLARAPRPPTRLTRAEVRSAYVSGRDIGDEYRYVLDRQTRARRPGTLLERPGLLLNPWAVRATTTAMQEARTGAGWDAPAAAPAPAPAMAPGRAARFERPGADADPGPFVDYLPDAARILVNLRPDAEGLVRVAMADLGPAWHVRVVVVDPALTTEADLALPERALPVRDRRLKTPLDPHQHLAEDHRVDAVPAGATVTVDARSGKVELVDSVARAHQVLGALGAELGPFDFLPRWSTWTEEEKRRAYGQFACHELHLFVYFKDPAFFERVVAPYLAHKRDKTFVDHWLLGHDLAPYCEPWAFGRLNSLERALLGHRIPTLRATAARLIGDAIELEAPDPERDARLVATLLGATALDGGGATAAAPEERLLEVGIEPLPEPEGVPVATSSLTARAKRAMPPPAPSPAGGAPAFGRGDGDAFAADLRAREAAAPLFRPADTTMEWVEHDWWHRRNRDAGPTLVAPNRFWLDFARHTGGPFLSPHLGACTRTLAEAVCALAVLDLPFAAGVHTVARTEDEMRVTVGSNALAARTERILVAPADGTPPLVVGQTLLRADARTHWVHGEERERYAENPLLTGVVYVARVVVTNPTPTRERMSVLVQIPEGSVPVSGGPVTHTLHLALAPYATQSIEVAFTFPIAGRFTHWGAHVSRGSTLLAWAPSTVWKVVDTPAAGDPEAWANVAAHGTTEALVAWLARENVGRADLGDIAWRMRDRDAFDRVTSTLAARGVYADRLWAYALLHQDRARMIEWLRHQDGFLRAAGPALEGGLVEVDPIARTWFEHLEYAPLIHARAHPLGDRRRILNDGLSTQIRSFLEVVAHQRCPSPEDWLAWAHHLFCLDRIEEARGALARVRREEVTSKLQLDVLSAYGAIVDGDLATARARVTGWRDVPVDRWRRHVEAVLALIEEAEGAAPRVVDTDNRTQRNTAHAATAPFLSLRVERGKVELTHRNVSEVEIRVYGMDIELAFSRAPFVQGDADRYALVEPLRRWTLPLGEGPTEVPLPDTGNVVVEAVGPGVRTSAASYGCDLTVEVVAPWGQLRVLRRSTGTPLPATYIKAYGRFRGGEERFYKDGYTDAVGRFDYASLSTDALDHVERFAILVASDACGATVVEAAPPTR